MWRREQHCNSCNNCEQSKDDEAQSVNHHCGELPVVRHFRRLVFFPQLVRYDAQFLEDECEFSVRAETRRTPAAPVEQCPSASPSIVVVCVSTPEESCCRNCARCLQCARMMSEIIVDIQHVGEQTLGRSLLQLQLSHLYSLPRRVWLAPGSTHSQYTRQPVQEDCFDLEPDARARVIQMDTSYIVAPNISLPVQLTPESCTPHPNKTDDEIATKTKMVWTCVWNE